MDYRVLLLLLLLSFASIITGWVDNEHFLNEDSPERPLSDDQPWTAFNEISRQKRHLPRIEATPALAQDWMTLSPSVLSSHVEERYSEYQEAPLARVVPVFTSPSMSPPASSLITPSLEHFQVRNTKRRYYVPLIYTTPPVASEPPTVRFEGLLTPTFSPVQTVITPTPTFDLPLVSSSVEIVPTPSYALPLTSLAVNPVATVDVPSVNTDSPQTAAATTTTTATAAETVTSMETTVSGTVNSSTATTVTEDTTATVAGTTTTSSSDRSPFSPPAPNQAPQIDEIIQKIQLFSGMFWKYEIPAKAFVDFEDGNTRSLRLEFSLGDGNREVPENHWIQFNRQTQTLEAIPTHNETGKHEFFLTAMDSSGARVKESLEIHVLQPRFFRKLNHMLTLNAVSWSIEYDNRVKAVKALFERISSLFPGSNLESFHIHSIVTNGSSTSISWTNVTMPLERCPKQAIQEVLQKLADLDYSLRGSDYRPSIDLRKVLSPDFDINSVGLRFLEPCAAVHPTIQPEDQSPIVVVKRVSKIPAKYGQIFVFKIPSDMFRTSLNRKMMIEFLTAKGHPASQSGYIMYDYENQTVTGFALDKNDVTTMEFQIVARDPKSDIRKAVAVKIEFESPPETSAHTFEASLSVVLRTSTDLTVASKIALLQTMAVDVVGDSGTENIELLNLKEYLYNRNSGEFAVGESGENDIESHVEGDELEERNGEKDGYPKSENVRSRTARQATEHRYYELVWTNSSQKMQNAHNCPSDELQNVFQKIFLHSPYEKDVMNELKHKFAPDFEFLHMSFTPVGKCANHMDSHEIGTKPAVVVPPSPRPGPTSFPPAVTNVPNQVDAEKYDEDYYLRTIIPAVATIAVMLLVSCVIVIILIRYRRKQEKARFDVSTATRSGDAYPNETDAFLQKGRTPVIMESELQQHLLTQPNMISPVIMPPREQQPQQGQALHQMTPMRQLGKPAYQSLNTQSPHQPREPPPYHK